MIRFDKLTDQDIDLIGKIVRRARALMYIEDVLSLEMDISATHLSCPLKLQELLDADDFNFAHDVGGIQRHINRESGELENFFLPRYAA